MVLDEATGDRVSKTELKKREKQRRVAAQKAEKAANAQPPPAPKRTNRSAQEEAELDPRLYHENRSRDINRLRETQHPNPYPHKFHATTNISEFVSQYSNLKTGEERKDVEVRVMGRIFGTRSSGQKLMFYILNVDDTEIQVMCQLNNATNPDDLEGFLAQHEHLRRGDIIGVIGFPGRTHPKNRPEGELSIFARELILLSPCLHTIPSTHYGFKDQEERFRNRHLDLMMNESARNVLKVRGRVMQYVRNFLCDEGFLEVETPILNQIAGGATAKPFKTYYNAYDQEVYLRIAPELYLKELVVGGLPKVFEMGKLFRNEDADLTHNPEFTSCEFYEAGADMYNVMDRTEKLVSGIVKHIHGGFKTAYHTQSGEELNIDWSPPWRRVEMIPELEKATGEKFPPGEELHTEQTNAFLKRIIEKTGVNCPPPQTNARMIDKLVGEFIEENCINPTFITGHPQMMSPLAKKHRNIAGLCERFEAFVCRKEIVNAYTELNDPFDQRIRFEEQARQKAQGDDEAQLIDETFLKSMEYGLPPTGGFGMGIDRLVMFLTDKYSIRDVISFPYMRPEVGKAKEKSAPELVGIEPMKAEDVNAGK